MLRFDVLVVGAGLAGLQISRLLARKGVRVLLVDRKSHLAEGIHTTGIFVRQTLADFDFPAQLLSAPIRTVVLYSPALRSLTFVSDQDEFRVGRMGEIYLHQLGECERAGVRFWPSTRFADCTTGRPFSTVRLCSPGVMRTVEARFVVGADGARSRVAAALGLSRHRRFLVGIEDVISEARLTGPPRLECYVDPQLAPGYIAWRVYDGEQAHVGLAGDRSRFDPVAALARLGERIGRTEGVVVERRGGLIPVDGVLPRIANRYGLLVGDAAGAVSPLTAGGFDGALRFSTIAAETILRYLDGEDLAVLSQYSGMRLLSRRKVALRRLFSVFRSRAPVEIGLLALRLPPFYRLAREIFFGRGAFDGLESRVPVLAGRI